MKKTIFSLFSLFMVSVVMAQQISVKTKFDDAVPVLSIGTFHMGYTSDAHKTEFDEHDNENVRKVHDIAKMIARFKPTVIIVETTASYQKQLEESYQSYIENPKVKSENPNEISLLAFEVGRLSGSKRIYGIDHHKCYNYSLYYHLSNKTDTMTYKRYDEMMEYNEQEYINSLKREPSVLDMLWLNNQPSYLDYLINVNADMLTYVSTPGRAEGADEAAKFYHRNLIMLSNLNQIPLTKEDRVFILMGATHTAFFREWINRSPKYILEDTFQYLKLP